MADWSLQESFGDPFSLINLSKAKAAYVHQMHQKLQDKLKICEALMKQHGHPEHHQEETGLQTPQKRTQAPQSPPVDAAAAAAGPQRAESTASMSSEEKVSHKRGGAIPKQSKEDRILLHA